MNEHPPQPVDDFGLVPFSEDFDIDAVFAPEPEKPEKTASASIPGTHADAAEQPAAAAARRLSARLAPSDGAALSIADLLENNVRLEWPEAVAIAQALCSAVGGTAALNPHRSSIEPWNIQLTDHGDVRVLPGGPAEDPVVKQVGRVLRALLQDSVAPAELRLVASQASFEVPFYSSVDDLANVLHQFSKTSESDAIRTAFHRGVEAKFSVPAKPIASKATADDSVWPTPSLPQTFFPGQRRHTRYATAAAAVGGGVIAVVLLIFARKIAADLKAEGAFTERQAPAAIARKVDDAPLRRSPIAAAVPAPTPAVAAPEGEAYSRAPAAAAYPGRNLPGGFNRPHPTYAGPTDRSAKAEAPAVHVIRPAPPPPTANARIASPVATPPAIPRYPPGGEALDASERRAMALLAAGHADEAAIVFDSIVVRNPSYHLDPARATADSVAGLRRSKRAILPTIARRHLDDGREAFDAGDFYRAIAEAERADELLKDADLGGAPEDLQAAVSTLLSRASAAKLVLEEKIYSVADRDVVPPRPLGRQLPATGPRGVPAGLTGRLEILVGRSGQVESIRLYTPGNAFHDRMIVSAAKAWHYKPAMRNGKPVRFSLVMTITLPES